MSEKETGVAKLIAVSVAEPAPLGLTGLAVAALVVGLTDIGLTPGAVRSLTIPWVVFLGAVAQFIAGIMDFKRNNIFGATAFLSYSMLWFSLGLTLNVMIFTGAGYDIRHYVFGLTGFFVFSIILTIASLMTNKTLVSILVGIDLSVGALIPHYLWEVPSTYAGIFLIYTSAASFYGVAAVLLNVMAGKTILPLGKAIWTPKQQAKDASGVRNHV
jgi:succinate-acetate transporter protein